MFVKSGLRAQSSAMITNLRPDFQEPTGMTLTTMYREWERTRYPLDKVSGITY